jgi:thiol-disulfide isomerase/thioredoxin
MSSRVSIAAGVVSGVLAAALVIGAIVAFAPEPAGPSGDEPSPSAAPTPGPTAATPAPTAAATSTPTAGPIVGGFHVGQPAPPLVVPQVGGGEIDLAALAGAPVWVNFMATWCPECREEFPRMNGFAVRFADDGLIVLAIDVREEEGLVAAFAQSLNATFPVGLDLDGAAQRAWEAFALPVHFWIDADGIVRDGAFGGIGPDIMARGVGRILPGVEVTP